MSHRVHRSGDSAPHCTWTPADLIRYPGGGRRLLDAGAIFAFGRRPGQARIETMLALGAWYSWADLLALFGDA